MPIITIQFIVWDSSDPIYDSSAIFDDFHWLMPALNTPVTYR